jgi:hypothetical protein
MLLEPQFQWNEKILYPPDEISHGFTARFASWTHSPHINYGEEILELDLACFNFSLAQNSPEHFNDQLLTRSRMATLGETVFEIIPGVEFIGNR